MKVRNQELRALFTPEEVEQLKQRMAEAGVRNRSAFIRKMALDGYTVKLDTSEIREMISLLRRSSNNLNQIAKRLNATNSVYGADVADMQAKQDEIWELVREIAARLSTIQ